MVLAKILKMGIDYRHGTHKKVTGLERVKILAFERGLRWLDTVPRPDLLDINYFTIRITQSECA